MSKPATPEEVQRLAALYGLRAVRKCQTGCTVHPCGHKEWWVFYPHDYYDDDSKSVAGLFAERPIEDMVERMAEAIRLHRRWSV